MTTERWRFLVGLPTTSDEWAECRRNPERFDFHRQTDSPKSFEARIGRPTRDLLDVLKRSGCVVTRCCLNDLPGAFRGAEVVTLIAHWDERNRVELADGLYDWRRVADAIPQNFDGVLDLCVCHPCPMVRYLDARCKALIKYKPEEPSKIMLWLGLYAVMAAKLKLKPMSFAESLIAAQRELGHLEFLDLRKELDSAKRSDCQRVPTTPGS